MSNQIYNFKVFKKIVWIESIFSFFLMESINIWGNDKAKESRRVLCVCSVRFLSDFLSQGSFYQIKSKNMKKKNRGN